MGSPRFARSPAPIWPDATPDLLNAETVTIATTAGTTGAQTTADQFPLARITEFASHEEAAEALLAGEAVALIGSTPYPDLLAASDDRLAILGDEPLRTTVEAFAVPQGEQVFLTFLDNWIDAIAAEGFVDAARADWFGRQQLESQDPGPPP